MNMSDQFSVRSPQYLENFKPFRDETSLQQIASAIDPFVRGRHGKVKCLDAMAGTGIVGKAMQEVFEALEVTFLDKSERMLASESHSDNNRVLADIAETGLEDHSFDLILCRAGLNNLGEKQYHSVLTEFVRILKNDGLMMLQDHFAMTQETKMVINSLEAEVARLEGRSDDTYVPSMDELSELITSVGARLVSKDSFVVRISMRDRFEKKGLDSVDLKSIRDIVKSQAAIDFEEQGEDIVVYLPIFTLVVSGESISLFDQPTWRSASLERVETGTPVYERFSLAVIADALLHSRYRDDALVIANKLQLQTQAGLTTFFYDPNLLPPDADTNAVIWAMLLQSGLQMPGKPNFVLDEMLRHQDQSGVVQVWLSNERTQRVDAVVVANVVYLARLLGREEELKQSETFIIDWLESGAYLNGTRYYFSPDAFVYFMSRLLEFKDLKTQLAPTLSQALASRIGSTSTPIDLAMRVIAAHRLGIENKQDLIVLKRLQMQDGGWPADALYKQGSDEVYYMNRSVPTALARAALEMSTSVN